MRVAFVGGSRFVGLAAIAQLVAAGHEVVVAHSGRHEAEALSAIEHLHGERSALLAAGGPVERWRPEVLVDTFAGGATAGKGAELAACAARCGAGQIVAISSIDVYQHSVDAGVDPGAAPVVLPRFRLPLDEDAPRRAPLAADAPHDNVAMEDAVTGAVERVTLLRPGAIYGRSTEPERLRERTLVERIARRERRLELPDGGVSLFHRVALERVGRAVAAALERAPAGTWAVNVVDPGDWTYAGLAAEIGRLLDWEWEPARVAFADTDHPWQVHHPVLASDRRLVDVLEVTEPDPAVALEDTVRFLWEALSRGGRSGTGDPTPS